VSGGASPAPPPPPPTSPAASDRVGQPLPDAVVRHWADRAAPRPLRPYLRLARIERPIGWWLLLLPCWWSAALAAIASGRPIPDPVHCLLFWIGAVAMRGAGSTYNDIVDRKLDARVERTLDRPLPSGQVSVPAALAFLAAQALVGLLVLLQLNRFAIATGIASLGIVALYPFMKRVIWLPQIVLGLAFAWGGLMGWAAAFGRLDWPAVLIYLAAVAWTVGYDTIYALQDIEDDEVAGIKSSARLFGAKLRPAVAVCYALAVALLFASLAAAGAGMLAYVGAGAFAAHLAAQVATIDPGDGELALRLFRSNRDAGLILFAGLTLDAACGPLA
jgi:4-hydroxybenzoate polyprenyltransferase